MLISAKEHLHLIARSRICSFVMDIYQTKRLFGENDSISTAIKPIPSPPVDDSLERGVYHHVNRLNLRHKCHFPKLSG